MSRAWMPLYVGDYLADTAHLSTLEHGAYLLLIMHYWQRGGLPTDDRSLARIARVSPEEWNDIRTIVQRLFNDDWTHKRIEFELTEAARISAAGRAGGIASGVARKTKKHEKSNDRSTTVERPLNDPMNDRATICEALQSQSQDSVPSELPPAEPVGEDPKAKLFRVGKTILVSFGVAEKRTGALLGQWLKQRSDPIGLLAAIQYARDQNVADPIPYISAVVSKEKSNGHGKQTNAELAFELANEVRERELAAGIVRPSDAFRSA